MAGLGQEWEFPQVRVLVSMSRGEEASLCPHQAVPTVTSLHPHMLSLQNQLL